MKKYLYSFIAVMASLPIYVSSQGIEGDPDPSAHGLTNPLGENTTFEGLIGTLIEWLIKIGAPILVIFIIWGGFQILTAGDNENKYKSGKNTIMYAVIGYAIILLAGGLISVIKEFLGVSGQ